MPVWLLISSIARWLMVRTPNEAKLTLARIGLGVRRRELGDGFAGTDGLTSITSGSSARPATGAMSRWKSNGSDL